MVLSLVQSGGSSAHQAWKFSRGLPERLRHTVYETIASLGKPALVEAGPLKPAVPIRHSVQPGYVVCLKCGWRGKMLRRHLTTAHQLNGEAYRARWGLSRDYPLTAPDYAK